MERNAAARSVETDTWRSSRAVFVLVVAPIAVLLLLPVTARRYFDPMFVTTPEWLGIPLGEILMAIPVGWGLLGGWLVARSRRPYALAVGLLLFTIPACFVIILGPAIILILQNLG